MNATYLLGINAISVGATPLLTPRGVAAAKDPTKAVEQAKAKLTSAANTAIRSSRNLAAKAKARKTTRLLVGKAASP